MKAISQVDTESAVDSSTAANESEGNTGRERRGAGGEITSLEDLLVITD